jgi:hypothetical protein
MINPHRRIAATDPLPTLDTEDTMLNTYTTLEAYLLGTGFGIGLLMCWLAPILAYKWNESTKGEMTMADNRDRYQVLTTVDKVVKVENFDTKRAALLYQAQQIIAGRKSEFWDTLDNPMSNLFRIWFLSSVPLLCWEAELKTRMENDNECSGKRRRILEDEEMSKWASYGTKAEGMSFIKELNHLAAMACVGNCTKRRSQEQRTVQQSES